MTDRERVKAELSDTMLDELNFSDFSVGVSGWSDLREYVRSLDDSIEDVTVVEVSRDSMVLQCGGHLFEVYWEALNVESDEFVDGSWVIR